MPKESFSVKAERQGLRVPDAAGYIRRFEREKSETQKYGYCGVGDLSICALKVSRTSNKR